MSLAHWSQESFVSYAFRNGLDPQSSTRKGSTQMSVRSRKGILWFLLLLVWRGPMPVVHSHELSSGGAADAVRLELHQTVLHAGGGAVASPGGWHWHWVLPDQMLVAMGAEHLACPVVQPESVGIEGALFDRHDGGASEEWSCRWVCDMAAGDLIVSQDTATGSSVARMAYRSVWPKGHLLRC